MPSRDESESRIRAKPNEIRVSNVQKVKMEDGDILCVTVPIDTPHKMIMRFREQLEADIQKKFGDKCHTIVVSAEPGAVTMDIAKRNELGDIYQRLDDLHSGIENLRHEVLG